MSPSSHARTLVPTLVNARAAIAPANSLLSLSPFGSPSAEKRLSPLSQRSVDLGQITQASLRIWPVDMISFRKPLPNGEKRRTHSGAPMEPRVRIRRCSPLNRISGSSRFRVQASFRFRVADLVQIPCSGLVQIPCSGLAQIPCADLVQVPCSAR